MVGHARQRLPKPIGEGLLVGAVRGHLVRFINNDQIPSAAQQAVLGILNSGDPRNRGDDLIPFLPRVHAVVGPKHVAADHLELLAKLFLHLPLPLERKTGGGDDERPLHEATNLQLLEQQARHDGLARAGIVGEEEANPRHREEVVVNGLKLVRERVNTGNGERKVGIVFIGESQPKSLNADAEPHGSPSKGSFSGVDSS